MFVSEGCEWQTQISKSKGPNRNCNQNAGTHYEDIYSGILQKHHYGGVPDKQLITAVYRHWKIHSNRLDLCKELKNINTFFVFYQRLGGEGMCIWTQSHT